MNKNYIIIALVVWIILYWMFTTPNEVVEGLVWTTKARLGIKRPKYIYERDYEMNYANTRARYGLPTNRTT